MSFAIVYSHLFFPPNSVAHPYCRHWWVLAGAVLIGLVSLSRIHCLFYRRCCQEDQHTYLTAIHTQLWCDFLLFSNMGFLQRLTYVGLWLHNTWRCITFWSFIGKSTELDIALHVNGPWLRLSQGAHGGWTTVRKAQGVGFWTAILKQTRIKHAKYWEFRLSMVCPMVPGHNEPLNSKPPHGDYGQNVT